MNIQNKLGQFVRVKQPISAPPNLKSFRAILRGIGRNGDTLLIQEVDEQDNGFGYPYAVEAHRVNWNIPNITRNDVLTRRRRQQDKSEAWGYGWIDRYCPTRIYSCHPGYNSLPEIWRDTRGVGNIAIIEISTERRIWEKKG